MEDDVSGVVSSLVEKKEKEGILLTTAAALLIASISALVEKALTLGSVSSKDSLLVVVAIAIGSSRILGNLELSSATKPSALLPNRFFTASRVGTLMSLSCFEKRVL